MLCGSTCMGQMCLIHEIREDHGCQGVGGRGNGGLLTKGHELLVEQER